MASRQYCHVVLTDALETLDSSWTLNNGQTICHYFQTDATLNSSKLLDTDGGSDGIATSSRQKLLTDERPDA